MNPITLTEDCIIIEVPEDAGDLKTHWLDDIQKLVFSSQSHDPLKCGGDMVRFPPGSWSILTEDSRTITDEQARRLVEALNTFISDGGRRIDVFVDYLNDFECGTAVESFHSLIKSKNGDPSKRYVVLTKTKP